MGKICLEVYLCDVVGLDDTLLICEVTSDIDLGLVGTTGK